MPVKTGCFLLLLTCFAPGHCPGQDPVFSQTTASPLLINPAFAGLFNGSIRAGVHFKNYTDLPDNQYLNQMTACGIDTRYQAGTKDFWTLQGLITSNKIGDPLFVNQEISIGGGFIKLLKRGQYGRGTQYLSLAFQFGMEQHSLGKNTWFSNQYDPLTGGVNFSLPTGEPGNGSYASTLRPDLQAGIVWSNSWEGGQGIYAGISMFHINNPKYGFIPNMDNRIARRMNMIAGGTINISENTQFLPAIFYFRQGAHQRISPGIPFRFSPRYWKDNALRAGVWLQGTQSSNSNWQIGALTFQAIFEIKSLHVGLAYDIGQKPLSSGNFSRNSFELQMTWTKPAHYKMKIACPRL
jgi:type IX secretion system PorP/SprF family membrane protein